jgi:hypothetical protein
MARAAPPAAADRAAVDAARVGPYLLLRTHDASGDEHVDVFELRAGPVHLESFSGNRGLPAQAACDHLGRLLGRAATPRWQRIRPERAGAPEAP